MESQNGSVYTIIHEHLGVSEVSARWVPRNLNMQDRQQRVESSQEHLKVYKDFHTRNLETGFLVMRSNLYLYFGL